MSDFEVLDFFNKLLTVLMAFLLARYTMGNGENW